MRVSYFAVSLDARAFLGTQLLLSSRSASETFHIPSFESDKEAGVRTPLEVGAQSATLWVRSGSGILGNTAAIPAMTRSG